MKQERTLYCTIAEEEDGVEEAKKKKKKKAKGGGREDCRVSPKEWMRQNKKLTRMLMMAKVQPMMGDADKWTG